MISTSDKDFLFSTLGNWKKEGHRLGFVPTMGALHPGHLALLHQARSSCDRVVVSIFVNPLQFNQASDLANYPRMPEEDARQLETAGADLLYAPDAAAFYPEEIHTRLDFGPVSDGLEGKMRPGHFSGVGIVLSRLFHLIQPDAAFFGAKDLQQVAVVRALVRDLGFPVQIIRCPTVREPSGLALSSRNARLSSGGRKKAAVLYRALEAAVSAEKQLAGSGRQAGLQVLSAEPEVETEYFELVDATTMKILETRHGGGEPAFCVAARLEDVRLIDNCLL